MAAPSPTLSGGSIDQFYNRVAIVRSSDNRVIDIVMSGGALFTDAYNVQVVSVAVLVGEACEIYWIYDQFNSPRFYTDGANYEQSLTTPITVFPGSIAVGNNPPISDRGYYVQFPDGTTQDSAVNRTRLTTFTALQEFAAGISSGQIIATDPTDGIGYISTKGPLNSSNARIGVIRLGYTNTAQYNTLLHNSSGTFTIYNGFSSTGSNLLNINSTVMNVNVPVSGMTFTGNIVAPNIVNSVNGATGSITVTGGRQLGITQNGNQFTFRVIDGATSELNAGALYGVSGAIYASNLATGLLYGGIITINAGNSAAFDITAGRGQIHIAGATWNSGPSPTLTYINWPAQTGITLSGITAADTTWLYFDNTGALKQQSTYYTDAQIDQNIIIGALVHPTRSYISLAKTIPNVGFATDKQYEQFIRLFGPLKQSGHTIAANGANLKLNRSSGVAFVLGRNWINDPNNPTIVTDNAQTDCTFWRYYRGATAGTFVTVLNQTAIDPDQYDNGSGILQTVPSNKQYTIQRLFYFPGTPSVLGVYYGRGTYASMPDAAANIQFEDFTEIDNTKTNAISVGYIIVKKGTTNLTTAIAADDCRIIQSGIFRSTVSGGGSVATKLDDLTDVTITGITDDQTLIYDIATSQWLNTPIEHITVSRFNGLTGIVGISAGTNITITQSGKTFTISSTASGGSGDGSATGFTYTSSAPSSPTIGYRWIDSNTGKEYVYVNDGSSSQWIEPVSSNGLVGATYTSSLQLLEFGLTGSFAKLGIGTTAPNYPLDVNGIANFRTGLSAAGATLNGNVSITGTLNGAGATFTGAVISDGGFRISSSAINAQTGTTYSLLTADNGKIITMNNGSSSTVTIPSGLPVGYNTTVIQLGVGQVGFTGSGTTINSAEGKLNIANRYSAANIISYTSNTFILAGGLTG